MVRRPGIFYGQCSEICGVAHAFMPIVIHGYPMLQFFQFELILMKVLLLNI